jgi:hypothetical protein
MNAGLQGGAFARQASRRRNDFADAAVGGAADRTARIAVDGFGVDGAAGSSRSLDSVLAVFARESRRAGLALLALRTGRPLGLRSIRRAKSPPRTR